LAASTRKVGRVRKPIRFWSANLSGRLIIAVVKPFMLNSKQGAAVSLYLAASPEVAHVFGEYFVKSKPAIQSSFAGSEVDGGSLDVDRKDDQPALA